MKSANFTKLNCHAILKHCMKRSILDFKLVYENIDSFHPLHVAFIVEKLLLERALIKAFNVKRISLHGFAFPNDLHT
jgi:hypothetical protein